MQIGNGAPPDITPQWEPLPEKVNVGIFRFPWAMQEMSTTVDWIVKTSYILNDHPRVSTVVTESIVGTPIDMCRNKALKRAKELGLHFAIFIDSDMWPDYEFMHNGGKAHEFVQPFMPGALDFALKHNGPCVIGAPYCSAPPEERVLVMKWTTLETGGPEGASHIKSYDREEVSILSGMKEVAALA